MANKRMFSLKIIDTDMFLDMPLTSQNLYFHLNMRADDDGFISNPKKIVRMIGCNEDDMKILFTKELVIPFETGICVIRHWKIHNYIAKDRYHETIYTDEKKSLSVRENGMYTECIQNDDSLDTQIRLDKIRLDKNRIDYTPTDSIIDYFNEITGKQMRYTKASREPIHARLAEGFTVEDCRKVIDIKYAEWKDDPDMQKYISIQTFFGVSKFDKYLNQEVVKVGKSATEERIERMEARGQL